ncbi:unnamed protein product [Rotaria sordida]|uniref:Ionotropic glutamate receptor C-terminal domain-containing protein n=3 Tax=Rotaria sordida TaxID=392033 RepID=A0A819PLW6_9BILA|nr:unnamed protein product [Rotaria sordida]
MFLFWNYRWFLLHFIFEQLHINYVITTWPTSNTSNIQLLGLFKDAENTSSPTDLSVHSRAMFKAAVLLSQQYNITIEGQFIGWQTVQTGASTIAAVSGVCQALSTSDIFGIVGPSLSLEVPITAEFAKEIGIPAVSYAATNPDFSNRNMYPAFYRVVPSDSAAAIAIVKLFIRFNWTSCIVIYQNDQFGTGGANIIKDEFHKNDLTVATMVVFDIETRSIRGNLSTSLIASSSRIVVLWATSTYTPLILQNALDSNVLGPKFTWILSSSVRLNSFDKKFSQQLIGMLTVEPTIASAVGASINTTLLNAACNIWQQYENKTFPGLTNINNYALFAFDTTWLLIQALEQLCSTTTNNSSSCTSFVDSSYCFHRRFRNSTSLFNIINNMRFLGVSGSVQFNVNTTDRIGGAYYIAQNVQPSSNGVAFVPVLTYTVNNGWQSYAEANVFIWPGNSLITPGSIATLNGVTLRIGVVVLAPFTIVDTATNSLEQATPQLTGYVPDLIAQLQTDLGFISDIRLAPSNLTYNQIIQKVANGDYDILIGDVTVTSARRKIVGFSESIFDNSLYIIMRNTPDVSFALFGFMKPFSRNLWLLSIGATTVAAIIICLLERKTNEVLQNMSIISICVMSWWYCVGNIIGYGVDFDVNTAAGRLLTFGLYILSIVLVASYTANLASDLTIQKAQFPISGVDDLKAGKILFGRIGVRVGSASQDYYLREISKGVRNFYPLPASKQVTFDSLLSNIVDASFIDSGVGQYVTNNIYCNLTLIGQPFDQSIFGIVTPIEWNYAQILDVKILALRESGTLYLLQQKWFQSKTCPDSLSNTPTALDVPSMGGLFLVFGVIIALSFLLFAWQQYIKNHVFSLPYCNKFSVKKKRSKTRHSSKLSKTRYSSKLSKTRHSSKPSEHAENYKVSSSEIIHF